MPQRGSRSFMKQGRQNRFPRKPKRLHTVFGILDQPLYFVTFNSSERKKILANHDVHKAFRSYAEKNGEQGRAIGGYVIMPDHVHFFARLVPGQNLSTFVRLLKQSLTKALRLRDCPAPFWQGGFFDHVLRSSESYADKWAYVRSNPVRDGLVDKTEDWPYQGEVIDIDRA